MPVDVDSWRQPEGDYRYPPPSPDKLKHDPPDPRHFEALAEEEKQTEERSTMRKLSSSSSSSSSMSSSLAASFSCSIDAATARHLVRIVLSLGLWLWYLVARAIVSTVLARLVPGSVKREKTYPVNGGGDPASELGEDRPSITAQRSGGGGSSSNGGGYSEHYSSSSKARLRLRHSLRKRKEQIILYGSPRALSPVSPASPASPASPVSPASPASYYSSSPSSSVPNSLSSSPDNSPALFYHRQIKQALLEHSNRIRYIIKVQKAAGATAVTTAAAAAAVSTTAAKKKLQEQQQQQQQKLRSRNERSRNLRSFFFFQDQQREP